MDSARPVFPKRAIVTAGMPYGNKELHLGHIGGVFIHADCYARFLRDRIGGDNVIFVSGTDCYGSPILEDLRKRTAEGSFKGDINDFVAYNHGRQKEVLDAYHIDINLFGASSFGPAAENHRKFSDLFLNTLYENGFLEKMSTSQFYDPESDVFLNGRQVVGKCPIQGCRSERGYADECSLGHQYMPKDLIDPQSTLSGKKPEMKDVDNWYFRLDGFHDKLEKWIEEFDGKAGSRPFVIKSVKEFLAPPVIYVKRDQEDELEKMHGTLPAHTVAEEPNPKAPIRLVFKKLEDREKACVILAEHAIRYRTGKTLVPFRLTGNTEWGVPAPVIEGLEGLTVWVWPESLWAPISFSTTYLEKNGKDADAWKEWWCSKDAGVYQFIGEDNVYFYGPVEMALFMGMQGKTPAADPPEGELQFPSIIANNHLLFLDKKASSSSEVKPPTAMQLLDYYTPEQLRAHFLGLGLGIRSVGFKPKPLNPDAKEQDGDPVLKEGNLLSNVFNRAVRSVFYAVQKYTDGKIPVGSVSENVLEDARRIVLDVERLMHKCEFHVVIKQMDLYLRSINKHWSQTGQKADKENDMDLMKQALIDTFHMVRTATVLMHPIAPRGTEMILDYLRLDASFWSWEKIFEPVYSFMEDPETHTLKELEPRVDFFEKHESQLKFK